MCVVSYTMGVPLSFQLVDIELTERVPLTDFKQRLQQQVINCL